MKKFTSDPPNVSDRPAALVLTTRFSRRAKVPVYGTDFEAYICTFWNLGANSVFFTLANLGTGVMLFRRTVLQSQNWQNPGSPRPLFWVSHGE
jgi:hypothetical protein